MVLSNYNTCVEFYWRVKLFCDEFNVRNFHHGNHPSTKLTIVVNGLLHLQSLGFFLVTVNYENVRHSLNLCPEVYICSCDFCKFFDDYLFGTPHIDVNP